VQLLLKDAARLLIAKELRLAVPFPPLLYRHQLGTELPYESLDNAFVFHNANRCSTRWLEYTFSLLAFHRMKIIA